MTETTTLGKFEQPITGKKLTWVLVIVCVNILLMGAIFAVDWMVFLYEEIIFVGMEYPKPFGLKQTLFTGVAKSGNSVLCLFIVLIVLDNRIDKKDWILLFGAFLCMVPTDIIMRIIDLAPGLDASTPIFMVGGVLSIFAHFLLLFRHGRKFPYWRKSSRDLLPKKTIFQKLWLPILIYGSAVVAITILWKDMAVIDHLIIGPVYTLFFTTNTWIAWEAVRYKLYPKRNGIFAAIGVTLWYLTEVVGEIFNVQIGLASSVAFQLVWMVYGPGILLLALSGIRYKE
ncbi:MAG: hypothetical protein JW776_03840 [Candidatus Lokiarchaeota archaeon]|nr:hypothetical protein [Candidatus Lokiarchaeota archaeon]